MQLLTSTVAFLRVVQILDLIAEHFVFAFTDANFLGRHFGCRPLDPTLDIWSNFVKKEKEKKHFTSFLKQTI